MAANPQEVKNEAEFRQQILPDQFQKELNFLLNAGRDLYGRPYQKYAGDVTAPQTAAQVRARKLAMENIGQWRQGMQDASQHGNRATSDYTTDYRRYMNPYEDAAIRAVTQDVNRNFTENVLPAIEARFIRAGQHGASGQRDMVRRATRDMNQELLARIGQMRAHGYDIGSRIHASDQERRLKLADLYSQLSRQGQAQNLADIESLNQIGGLEQQHQQNVYNTNHNEWLRQQAWPFERLLFQQSLLRGLPFPMTETRMFGQAPQPQLNNAGQLGALASALLGLRKQGGI